MTQQQALVVLNAIPGLYPSRIKHLVAIFGCPQAVLGLSYQVLVAKGGVAPAVAANIIHFSKDKFLEDEYNLVRRKGIQILTSADDVFPESLRLIPGAPFVLYIQGRMDLLYGASVAMVGARNASYYGLTIAQRFAARFAKAGLMVVSGLARGIDTASHRGCLKAGGKTIAVLGCGLNHVYPKENQELMARIGQEGAVVSELPMHAPPIPVNFPRRNRIITGLSLATVVVEAGAKSGALISADYALEQGKDVYAVAANIDVETAFGSNRLIKDGAHLALSPEDVLEGLNVQSEFKMDHSPNALLSDAEMKIYNLLSLQPMHVDELLAQTSHASSALSEIMLNLELKHAIRPLPGQYYVRNEHA